MSRIAMPSAIAIHDLALEIDWSDGHHGSYPHRFLRAKCLCAVCGSEPNLSSLASPERNYQAPSVSDDIRPVRLGKVGNYGLSVQWSDGHSTGVYTYEYLKEICQCNSCLEKKGNDPAPSM